MESTIIVAVIVGVFSAISALISAKYVANVRVLKLEMKMDELERKVTKHNGLVERQYNAESRICVLENQMSGIKFEY